MLGYEAVDLTPDGSRPVPPISQKRWYFAPRDLYNGRVAGISEGLSSHQDGHSARAIGMGVESAAIGRAEMHYSRILGNLARTKRSCGSFCADVFRDDGVFATPG